MGTFYDTNVWHWVRDAAAYARACDTIMLRACWRDPHGAFLVDDRFHIDRDRFAGLAAVGAYQRVWDGRSPEWQADFFADTTGPLRANEWPMLDVETEGPANPVDFCRRWLTRYEARTSTRCAVYLPFALWSALRPLVGDRLVVTPAYSRRPSWKPYDVWQDSQTAPFPGGGDAGDRNQTALTGAEIVARTRPDLARTSAPSTDLAGARRRRQQALLT